MRFKPMCSMVDLSDMLTAEWSWKMTGNNSLSTDSSRASTKSPFIFVRLPNGLLVSAKGEAVAPTMSS